MSWIETLEYEESTGRLRSLYDCVRAPSGQIDAILKLHSLRPHTLEGHLTLYKSVLHHSANRLPKPLLETIGVWVSLLNGCAYCVEHHFAGLRRLLEGHAPEPAPEGAAAAADETAHAATARSGPADRLRAALESGRPERALDARAVAALRYAEKLTRGPGDMRERDVAALREAGFDDGEILEINQVAAYFAYANRTVLGLGARTGGEALGLSPSDPEDAGSWQHR